MNENHAAVNFSTIYTLMTGLKIVQAFIFLLMDFPIDSCMINFCGLIACEVAHKVSDDYPSACINNDVITHFPQENFA